MRIFDEREWFSVIGRNEASVELMRGEAAEAMA